MRIAKLKDLASWRPGRLAWNTAHAGVWNVVRVILLAMSLLLMARQFGAAGYGALAGTVALYATCAQLTGIGSGVALGRHLARNGEIAGRLRSTQAVYFLTGAALCLLAWPASCWLLGRSLDATALGLLAAAEIIVAPALRPLAFLYQARERLSVSGGLLTVAPVARFAAAVAASLLNVQDLTTFAAVYFGALSVVTAASFWWFWPRTQTASSRYPIVDTIREGAPFAVSGLSTTAGRELDKTIILRMVGDTVAGQYAAAYRVVIAAQLPVNSLILAAAPRMFRSGIDAPSGLQRALLITTLAYATAASLALIALAPVIVWILGDQFRESAVFLRWLCVILVTGCLRQLVTAQLTTTNLQGARNAVEIIGLAIFLSVAILLIPEFGAHGAIFATAFADFIVIGWAYRLLRHPPQTAPQV